MIPYSTQCIGQDDIEAVFAAMRSTHLTQGALTQEFEEALANNVGVKYAISFNSATSALYALYGAFMYKNFPTSCLQNKEKPNIYFITSPISFVATTNMMLQWGIKPIFCDVKSDGNINEKAIMQILDNHPEKSSIKAIVSIDYAGKSVEANTINAIAKAYRIAHFTDSSHSFGGTYHNRPVGSLANASVFSFHALKSITTAEGGAILTNDAILAHFARLIQSHGVEKNELWHYDCTLVGMNLRLSEIGAALGLSQLKKIKAFINGREHIVQYYNKILKDNPYFHFIPVEEHIRSSRHLCPILLKEHLFKHKEHIFASMHKFGLGVQVHYKPIYHFKAYKQFFDDIHLANAERFYNAEISIPCHPLLDTTNVRKIAHTLLQACENVCGV